MRRLPTALAVALVASILFQSSSRAVATGNVLAKWNASGDLVDSTISDVGGNVGIGTPNPAGLGGGLGVQISSASTAGPALVIESTDTGGHKYSISSSASDNGTGPGYLRFNDMTAVLDRMVITPNGHVGIGTISPQTKLDVAGDITVSGNINAKWQDVAEWVSAAERLPAGTVVIVDKAGGNRVE